VSERAGELEPASTAGAGKAEPIAKGGRAGTSLAGVLARFDRPKHPSARFDRPKHPSLAFAPLKWTSFFHSLVYTSLLICAFALGKPQPATLVLGWTHGLLWIGMSFACIAAARTRIVSLRLAVAVAVLGGIGPFFGSYEFVREQRRRALADARFENSQTSAPRPDC
jgi:hypothetical protein